MGSARRWMIAIFVLVAFIIILYPILSPVLQKIQDGPHPPVSIGYVDVQKVFENSSRGKMQIAAFQEELGTRQQEVSALSNKVETMRKELQLLAQKGNKAALQQKLPQFQQAEKQLVAAQQAASQELQKTQADVDKAFMIQLKTVLDEVRAQEKLDVIQAYDANKVLSYDSALDVTQKALVHYNKKYPPDSEAGAK